MSLLFIILTPLSVALVCWQWACGLGFPLHRRSRTRRNPAAVTVLKPLKGWDEETRECLESWLVQDYSAPVQILVGVDADDIAARDGIHALLKDVPEHRARLILCHRGIGPHPKVAKLVQMLPQAAHSIIVISDADVWAPRDFLGQTTPLLDADAVGLVNCFYCIPKPATLAMRWVSITINADFWTQVLQSNSIHPQDFALGAVMMTRKREIDEIGGFVSYIDYLADDYQLGHRIAGLGRRIQLSPLVVECRSSPTDWRDVWSHQLRQARNIRACHPVLYFFSITNNVTLWCALWLMTAPGILASISVGLAQLVRLATALHSEYRLSPASTSLRHVWMIPIKDLLQAAVWACAFMGNKVRWRGEVFRIRAGGRLEPSNPYPSRPPGVGTRLGDPPGA
jgi:ceramide glucosyltransferase